MTADVNYGQSMTKNSEGDFDNAVGAASVSDFSDNNNDDDDEGENGGRNGSGPPAAPPTGGEGDNNFTGITDVGETTNSSAISNANQIQRSFT